MELNVKIKQHTPLIHFQWDQSGATLRATELKPKLDRYIRKYYDIDDDIRLKYQVRIKYLSAPSIKGTDKILNQDSMFFGNLKQPELKKKWEIYGSELELRFNTYFNNRLKDQIKEVLPACLALENFGTRNNKGNGCFFCKDVQIEQFEKILKNNAPSDIYYWDCNSSDVFFSIKIVYALLKSGVNLDLRGSKIYYKSAIYNFFKEKGITWDKKAIKQHFLPNAKANSWESSASHNHKKYVRVLLGGSDVQEWRHYNRKLFIKNAEFEKISSPIIFKVFNKNQADSRVYFFVRDIYKNVKGQFKFTMVGEEYCEAEFNDKREIKRLCDDIKYKLNNLTISSSIETIDWLNGLLKRNDLSNKLRNKVKSNIDSEICTQAKNLFFKRYQDMNTEEKKIIVKYNRLLIEENFTSSPKINNMPLLLNPPNNFDMREFTKYAADYINELTVSVSNDDSGYIKRTKLMLNEIVKSKIRRL